MHHCRPHFMIQLLYSRSWMHSTIVNKMQDTLTTLLTPKQALWFIGDTDVTRWPKPLTYSHDYFLAQLFIKFSYVYGVYHMAQVFSSEFYCAYCKTKRAIMALETHTNLCLGPKVHIFYFPHPHNQLCHFPVLHSWKWQACYIKWKENYVKARGYEFNLWKQCSWTLPLLFLIQLKGTGSSQDICWGTSGYSGGDEKEGILYWEIEGEGEGRGEESGGRRVHWGIWWKQVINQSHFIDRCHLNGNSTCNETKNLGYLHIKVLFSSPEK